MRGGPILILGLISAIVMIASGAWAQAPGIQADEQARGASTTRVLGLLVGAEAYGDDPFGLGTLNGPANDARLMAEALIETGARPEHLIVLTGAPGQDDAADRPGILRAMTRLADTARRGDQVVIHLSGHGWRQAEAVAGSEPDGMDELFLPVGYSLDDTGRAVGLLDDEIGAVIDTLRARGAEVIFIGDFCHAGDATRGRPDFSDRWRRSRLDLAEVGPDAGAYAAFFAAPASGRAMQGLAPIWAPLELRRPHGLLSVYLATALRDPAVRTWGQAAARVQADLLDHDIRDRAVRLDGPAVFEGDLDRPLPGRLNYAEPGWVVRKPVLRVQNGRASLGELSIGAGALHGLAQGDRVVLTEAGRDPRVILTARVEAVGATEARLVPDTASDAALWADVRARDGRPYTQEALWLARRTARAAADPVTLSAPPAVLERLDVAALGVTPAAPGQSADLYLLEAGVDLVIANTDSITAPGAVVGRLARPDAGRLDAAVTRAARGQRIRRLLARAGGATAGADALVIDPFLWRPAGPAPDICPPFDPAHALADAPPEQARAFSDLGLGSPGLPVLRACDVIFVRIRNTGETTLDVTPLTLSGDGAIWALPWLDGRPAVRFEPGRARMTAVQIEPGEASRMADESLVVLAVEADPLSGAPVSFAGLEQPPVGDPSPLSMRERTRGAATGGELAALMDLARFEPTRSLAAPVAPDRSHILTLNWRVGRADQAAPVN